MNGKVPASTTFYRPAEVAELLHCSEWWVKEQARRRRIPYCWIGGSYLFTEGHVAEIVRRHEIRPVDAQVPAPEQPPTHRRSTVERPPAESPVRLRARAPRRSRQSVSATT